MATSQKRSLRHRWLRAIRRRKDTANDLGQTGIIAVVAFSVLASLVGAVIVQTVVTSNPLFQAKAVEIYAHRALEAGQNAYLTAVNANPSLAQCNTNTNGAGTCSGIDYGKWNVVNGSNSSGSDLEYYSFGNPQPTFDPTTNALTSLSVQVVGAAYDPSAENNYLFDQETINVTPSNGFLENVWWSNYESYSGTGNYSTCNYNWKLSYNISGAGVSCGPVYFGPNDYLFGPVYTNDSVFVSPSPAFGTSFRPVPGDDSRSQLPVRRQYTNGMNGDRSNCSAANADVSVYDTINSADGPRRRAAPGQRHPARHHRQPERVPLLRPHPDPPVHRCQRERADDGGQPGHPEGTKTVNGTTYPWDTNNIASNVNNCPNNGTAPIPPNGVVFVQNATASQTQAWSNPFDDPTYNTRDQPDLQPGGSPAKKGVGTSPPPSPRARASWTAAPRWRSSRPPKPVADHHQHHRHLHGPVADRTGGRHPGHHPADLYLHRHLRERRTEVGPGHRGLHRRLLRRQQHHLVAGQPRPDQQPQPVHELRAGRPGDSRRLLGLLLRPDQFARRRGGRLRLRLALRPVDHRHGQQCHRRREHHLRRLHWVTGQSGLSTPSEGFCPYNAVKPNDALGLIANNYVEVNRPEVAASTQGGNTPTIEPSCGANPAPTCDPSDGTNGVTIDAAVLALTQSFVVNNYNDGSTEGPLLVYGSIQQFARGPIGTFSGASLSTGYLKHYTWDPLLDFISPPSYLVPSTPSWVLQGVASASGGSAVSTCPPLAGVYQQTVGGVIQDGPAITQYCSASPGGLPNFPTMTAPSVPTNVKAVSNPNGTVTVSWTDPQANNGSAITGYSVSSSPKCASLHLHQPVRARRHLHHNHRPDPAELVQLHGDGHQRRGHVESVDRLQLGDRPRRAEHAHQRFGQHQPERLADRELDRPGQQRLTHHQLHGGPEPGLRVLHLLQPERGLADLGHRFRRHPGRHLLVHGDGHQWGGHR